jgi:heme/copper-type cytochrome/quinol oxidase subunit 3
MNKKYSYATSALAVAWYWRFVDVIWLGLFVFVYWV